MSVGVPGTGSSVDMKDIVRRLISEVWNARDANAIASFYHAEVAEEVREHHTQFLTAFPDMHTTIEQLVAEDDTVVARLLIEGTHEGPFAGHRPTGRHVSFVSHRFYRLEDGKVAQTWAMQDRLGLMEQLGVLPSSPGEIAWASDADR